MLFFFLAQAVLVGNDIRVHDLIGNISLIVAVFRLARFGFIKVTALTHPAILTFHPCSAPHTRGHHVEVTGCYKNADVARSLYHRLCCIVPMMTTASSLHFYGNRHMEKQPISQMLPKTCIIIHHCSRCYSLF